MVFGDKTDFAIESMIEPGLKPPSSPWGRMRIWVEGIPIGDFDDPHCGLGSARTGFNDACEELQNLWTGCFSNLTDLEIWNLLDEKLYGYHGNKELEDNRTSAQIFADADKYRKYDFLTNWGEMFDRGGKSFLLRLPSNQLKVLNYDHNSEKLNSYLCNEFSFRLAAKNFSLWLDEQTQLLSRENA